MSNTTFLFFLSVKFSIDIYIEDGLCIIPAKEETFY